MIGGLSGTGADGAIAHHIAKLHNGTIHADNTEKGKGAIFSVKLPLLESVASY